MILVGNRKVVWEGRSREASPYPDHLFYPGMLMKGKKIASREPFPMCN